MSTTPPEQPGTPPTPPTPPGGPGYTSPPQHGYVGLGQAPGAILPIPGNAEIVVYLAATIVLAIIWAASDLLDAHGFATLYTWLTIGYILSRGIAKASRVLEQ
jgi:hypothetical protein